GLSSVPWRSPAQLTRLMRVQTHDCQTALLADPSTPSPSAPPLPFIVCRLLSVGLCRPVTAVIQHPSLINSLQSSRPLAYNPHLTAEGPMDGLPVSLLEGPAQDVGPRKEFNSCPAQ